MALVARDRVSRALGMAVVEARPGAATVTMTVREDMLNGHDICHGGFVFTLADTAMAYAANAANQVAVAAQAQIQFLEPARKGEGLTARAAVNAARGRTAVYDITVVGGDGRIVALFRGTTLSRDESVIRAAEKALQKDIGR